MTLEQIEFSSHIITERTEKSVLCLEKSVTSFINKELTNESLITQKIIHSSMIDLEES